MPEMPAAANLTGQTFGRLTVLERTPQRAGERAAARWACRCQCGNTTTSLTSYLREGKVTSCGCHRRENSRRKATVHGLSADPRWRMLNAARRRAERNGLEFDLTLADIVIPPTCPVLGMPLDSRVGYGRRPGSPSLDRRDNSRGYVRGNVAVISLRANQLKSDATDAEILALAAWLQR